MRGGDQVIPRPNRSTPGGPAPWASLRTAPPVAALQTALDQRGAGHTVGDPVAGQRESAVLVLVYEHQGEPWLVLTRRPWHMRSHPGEISFPGGGHEPADHSLWHTALREANEEVALAADAVDRIGELDRITTVGSRSLIFPYVAATSTRPELVPDPTEVEQILHVPVAELLLPEAFREEIWQFGDRARTMTFFDLVGNTVWGATAAMVRQLLTIWTGLDPDMDYIYDPR